MILHESHEYFLDHRDLIFVFCKSDFCKEMNMRVILRKVYWNQRVTNYHAPTSGAFPKCWLRTTMLIIVSALLLSRHHESFLLLDVGLDMSWLMGTCNVYIFSNIYRVVYLGKIQLRAYNSYKVSSTLRILLLSTDKNIFIYLLTPAYR